MASEIAVLALGFGLGLSLAAPPGPILALTAERTVHRGFWPGLAVPLGATTGDATLALLMGLGVIPLLSGLALVRIVLTLGGAALMLYFAAAAWRAARRPPELVEEGAARELRPARFGRLGGGFFTGYALAVTSPFNFGWWLGAGTALFNDYGPPVFFGFFAALVLFSVAFVWLVRWTSGRVRGVVRGVSYASAVLLTAFAALLFWNGATGLGLYLR